MGHLITDHPDVGDVGSPWLYICDPDQGWDFEYIKSLTSFQSHWGSLDFEDVKFKVVCIGWIPRLRIAFMQTEFYFTLDRNTFHLKRLDFSCDFLYSVEYQNYTELILSTVWHSQPGKWGLAVFQFPIHYFLWILKKVQHNLILAHENDISIRNHTTILFYRNFLSIEIILNRIKKLTDQFGSWDPWTKPSL